MPPRDSGVRRADPFPRFVRTRAYTIDTETGLKTAARGRVYTRADMGFGPRLEAVCAACCEASYNAGDHRGGWSDRPLYPDEDAGCWLCGAAVE